jgi:acyl carrier protein
VTTAATVRNFLLNELHWDEAKGALTPDFGLIENHVVDSMGLLMLVSFVEQQFGVELADEELVPEHFGTIGSIASLVDKKMLDRGRAGA